MIKETYRNKFEFFKDNVIESNAVGQTLLTLKDLVSYEYAEEKQNLKKITNAYMDFEDLVSSKIIKKFAIIDKNAPLEVEVADGSSYNGAFNYTKHEAIYEGDYYGCEGSKTLAAHVYLDPAEIKIQSQSVNGEQLKILINEASLNYDLSLKFTREKDLNSGECINKAHLGINAQKDTSHFHYKLNNEPSESKNWHEFDIKIDIEAEDSNPAASLNFDKNGNFCDDSCFSDLHGQAAEFLNANYYAEIDW